ncbi:DNA repair protein rad14 [Neolecta irregularis DAH-3]|uniref:DNA repair protein rad14 n=1 Tax=Neolecta irregularis (strain DAH-3) TaxID=1198029 RepID=A0A1U7LVN1_NEOID|nr:DNA repair protein rad14 [Neolecta irregularis DAH-3]|eukprot:OLL26730.1 DNA repair protein rad14 [Neolecta irregularis DAH-3]
MNTARSPPKTPPGCRDNNGNSPFPLTPEQVKRTEMNQLKAKALFAERLKEKQGKGGNGTDSVTGKREREDRYIQPARKFMNYIEYDFSKIKDTKGGFIVDDDKPEGRKKWDEKLFSKPFIEPPLSLDPAKNAKCRECRSVELDFTYQRDFNCDVCSKCIKDLPEKYSLLTKTECRTDYLLTEPELKDVEILPHRLKPNPHASNWSNMMLYLRYQAEEFAIRKWGSLEKLDEIHTERETKKKTAKDKRFMTRLEGSSLIVIDETHCF